MLTPGVTHGSDAAAVDGCPNAVTLPGHPGQYEAAPVGRGLDEKWLVELRGFEPLASCMPYTARRSYPAPYGCGPAVVDACWAPWLTVVDRWLAAPRRPHPLDSIVVASAV